MLRILMLLRREARRDVVFVVSVVLRLLADDLRGILLPQLLRR